METIAAILTGQTDEAEALAVHHRWLQEESRRLAEMAATVRATLDTLKRGESMDAQKLFRGFGENPYEDEARQRWGDARVDSSKEKLASLGNDRQQELMRA